MKNLEHRIVSNDFRAQLPPPMFQDEVLHNSAAPCRFLEEVTFSITVSQIHLNQQGTMDDLTGSGRSLTALRSPIPLSC